MYSKGLYPTSITKPSRITTHSATVIDNILTNIMTSNLEGGLLINDITVHLPVFVIHECKYKNYKTILNTELRKKLNIKDIRIN